MANQIKYAAILAAGKGARLDVLDTPKPLIKIGNKPLIIWNIEMLAAAGVKKIFIVIGHRGKEIQKELMSINDLPAELVFIEQADGTKEGVLHSLLSLKNKIDEDFILTMADTIFENSPYSNLLQLESLGGEVFSVIDCNSIRSEKSGANSKVKMDEGTITDVGLNLENYDGLETGVYLIGKNFLTQLAFGEVGAAKSLPEIFDQAAKKKVLKAVLLGSGEWFDVNTPAVQVRAEMLARKLHVGERKSVTAKILPEASIFSNFYRDKTMATNIVIQRGLVANLGNFKVIPDDHASSRHFLLVGSVVDKYYGDSVLNSLRSAGYDVVKIVVPTGESFKNISKYAELADQIFSYGMDKKSIILSLGGGVINNIAGLLASTLYRGIGLVHLPTSLMAQLDAAIDFKQAIDSSKGKNLIGSYYPASTIYIDPEVLATLDDRQIRNGISEAIKHALVQNKDFLRYLLDNARDFRDSRFLEKIIKESVKLKVPLLNGYVGDDYNEMLPQYGHSIGHAIEHLSSYEFLHGEAIAIGMCICAEIGKLMGVCDQEVVDIHYEVFEKYKLPTIIPSEISSDDILGTIRFDKHFVDGTPHMAIVEDVGKVWQNNGVYGAPISIKILEKAIQANKQRVAEKKQQTKKVLVTGGSKGIGLAITEELLKAGYSVYICARDRNELERTVVELSGLGQIDFDVLDLSDRQQIKSFCAGWDEQIYGIVNNAGICKTERIDEDNDVWDEVIGVNLSGLHFLTKGLSEKIIDGGKIVNISSQLGKIGRAGYGAYCASKFGVIGLTECWAKELGSRRINVNAVCPGWVNTEMSQVDLERIAREKNIATAEYKKMIHQPLEFKRFTEPDEVAKLVKFLLSEDASGITGRSHLMHTLWNEE